MRDIEKLKDLLNEWEVPFGEDVNSEGNTTLTVGDYDFENPTPDSPKVTGYNGFYTQFTFTPDGNFLSMGAWE